MTPDSNWRFPQESYEVLLTAGFELLQNSNLEGAARIFNGLIALDPFNSAPHGAMGAIREQELKSTEALQFYDAALELNPTDQYARIRRAELHLRLGNLPAAKADLSFASGFVGPSGDRARVLLQTAKR